MLQKIDVTASHQPCEEEFTAQISLNTQLWNPRNAAQDSAVKVYVLQMWQNTHSAQWTGIYTPAKVQDRTSRNAHVSTFEAVQFQDNVVEGFHNLDMFQKTFMEICLPAICDPTQASLLADAGNL